MNSLINYSQALNDINLLVLPILVKRKSERKVLKEILAKFQEYEVLENYLRIEVRIYKTLDPSKSANFLKAAITEIDFRISPFKHVYNVMVLPDLIENTDKDVSGGLLNWPRMMYNLPLPKPLSLNEMVTAYLRQIEEFTKWLGNQSSSKKKEGKVGTYREIGAAHYFKVKAGLEVRRNPVEWEQIFNHRAYQDINGLTKKGLTKNELQNVIALLRDFPDAQKLAILELEKL